MRKIAYFIFIVFYLISCNNRESKFETKIKQGYWLLYYEPKKQKNNDHYVRTSCNTYDKDGVSRLYYFNVDGSVDTTENARYSEFDVKWKFSSNDSLFKFGGKGGYYKFKYIKTEVDTIFLKGMEGCTYFKKGDITPAIDISRARQNINKPQD